MKGKYLKNKQNLKKKHLVFKSYVVERKRKNKVLKQKFTELNDFLNKEAKVSLAYGSKLIWWLFGSNKDKFYSLKIS